MLSLLLIVVLGFVVVLALAARKPDRFVVERSIRVRTAPELPFALLNDFHRWPEWSPWEKLDPAMQRSHEGAAAGQGAVYAWNGNKQAGAGRMQITESNPPNRIAIELEFLRPFVAKNAVEFVLRPEGEYTVVRWTMIGAMPFAMKVMQVFLDMDARIGKDFEAGLDKLKTLAEQA